VLGRDLAQPAGRLREVLDAARLAVEIAQVQHEGHGALAAHVARQALCARTVAALEPACRARAAV